MSDEIRAALERIFAADSERRHVSTPLDCGPDGAGMAVIAERVPGARLHVFEGCGHADLMERTDGTTLSTRASRSRCRRSRGSVTSQWTAPVGG